MYQYRAFGLGIHSEIPLRELEPVESAADVTVAYGRVSVDVPEPLEKEPFVSGSSTEVVVYWSFVGAIRISNGNRMVAEPAPGVDEELLAIAIQGVAMGILLHQRGWCALHASAVSVEGRTVAFLGYKGAGKSTTAAALNQRGYPLLTDDILALDVEAPPGGVRARRGIASVKLWPDAVSASLGTDPEELPELHSSWTKRLHRSENNTTDDFLPLHCIYVLDYTDDTTSEVAIEVLPPQKALIELVGHTYAMRFLGRAGVSAGHLEQCTQIVRQVPMRRLSRARVLTRLSEFVDAIEKDVVHSLGH